MGIGSFFASLFQKEEDSRREIRELDIEPVKKVRPADKKESSPAPAPAALSDKNRDGVVSRESLKEAAGEPAGKTPPLYKETPEALAASAEKKSYFQGKKELYYYLNQSMKTLYDADRQNDWDKLDPLDRPSDKAVAALDRLKEELPDKLYVLMSPFTDADNQEAPQGLKEAFLSMLLPFYPAYKDHFGEFRYNTFLNRDALELYRRLTGRKYRLGYHNRYASGQAAFEWKGERYKIYDDKGMLLCDAVFDNGTIKEGYAVVPGTAGDDPDWSVVRKGTFKDGTFTEDTVEYIYAVSIDSVQ